ncbi:class I SAM-dependent methyltransferase [Salidesulfovibrio onnuriiensis]|uniref:class I SAM-dependent methyltransferase n=1 Tax=Salidesulfovibrio onnuriiensis TaxID=2583823 RepID=UPI00164F0B3E|nr:class I SAM-dependent methyltransferase [Salidesulfovibrio onnuriiensis]
MKTFENVVSQCGREFEPFVGPDYCRVRTLEFQLQTMLQPALLELDDKPVLELGCGLGFKSLLWSRHAREVVGIDMDAPYHGFNTSEPSVVAGQRVLDSVGVNNVTLRAGDLFEHLDSCGERYSLIFSDYLMEHISDLPRLASCMHKALAPGGRTVHTVPTTQAGLLELVRANLEPSLRDVWEIVKNYAKRFVRGEKRHARFTPGGWIVPITHSEYTASYNKQLRIYELESYVFPLMEAGFIIESIVPLRETSVSILARKAL